MSASAAQRKEVSPKSRHSLCHCGIPPSFQKMGKGAFNGHIFVWGSTSVLSFCSCGIFGNKIRYARDSTGPEHLMPRDNYQKKASSGPIPPQGHTHLHAVLILLLALKACARRTTSLGTQPLALGRGSWPTCRRAWGCKGAHVLAHPAASFGQGLLANLTAPSLR